MVAPAGQLFASVYGRDPLTLTALTLAGVLAAILAGFGLAAYARRRSRSYLLVTLALSTLVARTVVGFVAYIGLIGPDAHHLLEHGLDVLMAALVIAAVFVVRTTTHDIEANDHDIEANE